MSLNGGPSTRAAQPTLFNAIFEFDEAIGRIDRDEDQPRLGGRELCQSPFGGVQRPDADPVAGIEPQREQSRRKRVGVAVELRPGPADDAVARRPSGAISAASAGPAPRGIAQGLADGDLEQRHVARAHDMALWCGSMVSSRMAGRRFALVLKPYQDMERVNAKPHANFGRRPVNSIHAFNTRSRRSSSARRRRS